jgi:hypothetical protein
MQTYKRLSTTLIGTETMIIDCDTHLMPREAFDGVDGDCIARKPTLKFNDDGLYVDVDFPGYPLEVTEPARYSLLIRREVQEFVGRPVAHGRLRQEIGHRAACCLAAISGWWSYLVEAELATKMARSHNEALLRLMKEYPDGSWAPHWWRCRMLQLDP